MAGLRHEVLDAIANPSMIIEGRYGVLIAVRDILEGKYLVVVYRETHNDGFVITSFTTRQKRFLARRKKLWPV